jgi:hypothetical protein
MPTARTIIRGALTDLGVVSAEEPLSASQCEDGLDLLNQLLDSLSTERLWIYHTPESVLTWPAGAQTRTWGVGGDIPTARPIKLAQHASYRDVSGYDYPLTVSLTQEEYAQISWKAMPSSWPQALYYAPTVPLGTLQCWPVPDMEVSIVVYPWVPLEQFAALDDSVELPPGYTRALRTGLALEAAPSYGVQPSPLLVRHAQESKHMLYVPNVEVGQMHLDARRGRGGNHLTAFYSGGG